MTIASAELADLKRALDEARARIAALEADVAEARRLEPLARLTGRVAHDFSNVLAAITGYSDLMLRALDDSSPLRRGAESIQRAAEWGQRLAQQLLPPGRGPVLRPTCDLNAVVAGVVRTLAPLLGDAIEVSVRLDPAAGEVAVPAGRIEQVAMNLLLNARDAMPAGGRLTVTTTPAPLQGHGAPGAVLGVDDTGVGMDATTRARAFEPYFTTKPPGRGTGLGLSTVSDIAREHGGRVDVTSEPGEGAAFRVWLPRAAAPAHRPAAATVLVVEAEAGVRELMVEILELHDYRVLGAADAEDALRLHAAHAADIALVIVDTDAPGVDGERFERRLRGPRAEPPILYLSGDPEQRHAGGPTLAKPFTVEALASTVREALAGRVTG